MSWGLLQLPPPSLGSAWSRAESRVEGESKGRWREADPQLPKTCGSLPEPEPPRSGLWQKRGWGDSNGVATGQVRVKVIQSRGLDADPQVPPDIILHSYLLALRTQPPQLLCPPCSHSPRPQFTFFFSPQVLALPRHRTVGLDPAIPLPASQRLPHLCSPAFPNLPLLAPPPNSQLPLTAPTNPLCHILRMQLLRGESRCAGGDRAGGPGTDPPHRPGCVLPGPAVPSGARGRGR